MDGVLSDGRTGKLWTCNKHSGHALGLLMRVRVEGHFVDRLLLFRETCDVGEFNEKKTVTLPALKTMGFVEGTMHDIQCDLCGETRTWWMGEAALERFIESRRRRASAPSALTGTSPILEEHQNGGGKAEVRNG